MLILADRCKILTGAVHVEGIQYALPLKKAARTAIEAGGGDPVTVLAIGDGCCMADLRRILGHSRWNVLNFRTLAEAGPELSRAGAVVVCESALPDGAWEDVIARASHLPFPPPVIVVAPHADDYLWMEVLNRGGYNVLGRPCSQREVFQVVSAAWLRRRSQGAQPERASAFRAG